MPKQFSARKRNSAIALVLDDGMTCAEAASRLGIRYNTVWSWVKQARLDRHIEALQAPFGDNSGTCVDVEDNDQQVAADALSPTLADDGMTVHIQGLIRERDLLEQVVVHLVKENFTLIAQLAEVRS